MLDKMMRFFRPLFLVGFAIAIVAYIAMFPKAYSELGPQGVAELLLVLPAALLCSASMGFFLGTIPAGFIWFARILRRLPFFIYGSGTVMLAIIFVLFAIPMTAAPFVFVWQRIKVRHLKSQLPTIGD